MAAALVIGGVGTVLARVIPSHESLVRHGEAASWGWTAALALGATLTYLGYALPGVILAAQGQILYWTPIAVLILSRLALWGSLPFDSMGADLPSTFLVFRVAAETVLILAPAVLAKKRSTGHAALAPIDGVVFLWITLTVGTIAVLARPSDWEWAIGLMMTAFVWLARPYRLPRGVGYLGVGILASGAPAYAIASRLGTSSDGWPIVPGVSSLLWGCGAVIAVLMPMTRSAASSWPTVQRRIGGQPEGQWRRSDRDAARNMP